MADPHHAHHDPIEGNIDSHPVKLAIGIIIGTVSLIIAIALVAQYAIGKYSRVPKDHPSMSAEAVAKRIAPVAQVKVDPNAPAAAPATQPAAAPAAAPGVPPPAAAKTAAAASSGGAGKSTYDTACAMCHGAGLAGAPKLGDKAAWSARLKQGMPALHASAIKGKGAMPPKGGNAALSDDAVKAAVDFMVAAAK